jgi:hypothetical protein
MEPGPVNAETCGRPPEPAAGPHMGLLNRQVALNVLQYMQQRLAPTIVASGDGVQVVKPGALTEEEALLHQAALRFLAAELKAGTPTQGRRR